MSQERVEISALNGKHLVWLYTVQTPYDVIEMRNYGRLFLSWRGFHLIKDLWNLNKIIQLMQCQKPHLIYIYIEIGSTVHIILLLQIICALKSIKIHLMRIFSAKITLVIVYVHQLINQICGVLYSGSWSNLEGYVYIFHIYFSQNKPIFLCKSYSIIENSLSIRGQTRKKIQLLLCAMMNEVSEDQRLFVFRRCACVKVYGKYRQEDLLRNFHMGAVHGLNCLTLFL